MKNVMMETLTVMMDVVNGVKLSQGMIVELELVVVIQNSYLSQPLKNVSKYVQKIGLITLMVSAHYVEIVRLILVKFVTMEILSLGMVVLELVSLKLVMLVLFLELIVCVETDMSKFSVLILLNVC